MGEKRRQWKQQGRQVLRKHYWIFVTLCLAAGVIGAEFTHSLSKLGPSVGLEKGENVSPPDRLAEAFVHLAADVKTGQEEQRRQEAREAEKRYIESSQENEKAVLGRSKGVLSLIVNKVSSGSYLITLAVGLKSLVGSKDLTAVILIFLSVALLCFVQIFLIGVYRVVMRRMFLEGRCYKKLPFQRMWLFFQVKRWVHAGFVMWVTGILEMLWSFTIVGGVIKYYSYYLVPFLVAENPELGAMEAITVSRKLMKGHKWECFLLEFSFLGWGFLGTFTLGITDILFTNPYRVASGGEFYAQLRREGLKKGVVSEKLLNDRYLFEQPGKELLEKAYQDVKNECREERRMVPVRGAEKFLAEYLGLTISRQKQWEELERQETRDFCIAYDKMALLGELYPTRLYPLPTGKKRRKLVQSMNFLRRYSIWSVIMIFFLMSCAGWIWEVSLHLITDGKFVNRGVMQGPWLPIYGSGSVVILLLLYRLRRHPAAEFVAAVMVCGILEYFSSYFLEQLHGGVRWWDYTGYFLNLNGRICAEGLLVFGIGGMAVVYLAAPFLDGLIRKLPKNWLKLLCLILGLVFLADEAYSLKNPNEGKGITNTRYVEQYRKIKEKKEVAGR